MKKKSVYNKYISLWTPYQLIVLLSVIICLVIVHVKYISIEEDIYTDLKHHNILISSSIHQDLQQKKTLLKVLGQRLIELGSFKKTPESSRLINEFLTENPSLIAFGLALPNGELVLTSDNLIQSNTINLTEIPEASSSFLQALKEIRITI